MSEKLNVVVWAKAGCHYCQAVKDYLNEENVVFQEIDVTNHDHLRTVLDAKYGINYVPVVEIGVEGTNRYQAVTEIGVEHLAKALSEIKLGV